MVAVVDADRLMDNIRVKAPGVLDGVIFMELFNTLDEFFKKSNIWWEDIPFQVLSTYETGDTVDIVATEGQMNRLLYVLNADNQPRRAVSMPIPGSLLFTVAPGEDQTWTARVALTVTDPVPDSGRLQGIPRAPDWILKKYRNGIVSGVLANLFAQPAKPYSNPRMAVLEHRKYKMAESAAVSEGRHQNLYSGQTWRYPRFAGGTQRSGGI